MPDKNPAQRDEKAGQTGDSERKKGGHAALPKTQTAISKLRSAIAP